MIVETLGLTFFGLSVDLDVKRIEHRTRAYKDEEWGIVTKEDSQKVTCAIWRGNKGNLFISHGILHAKCGNGQTLAQCIFLN